MLLFFLINLILFKQTQEHFQPRVHGFEVGMKLEVVHPIKPSIICPATVTKSLGPYYFAITTDYQEDVPSVTFCCHSDSPGIFPAGWCSRHQVELAVPASKWKEYHQLPWRNLIIKYKSVGNSQTCFGWNLCFQKCTFLSVNVFSMKVLIGDTIFYVSNWRQHWHVVTIRATWRSKPLAVQREYLHFSVVLKTLSIGPTLGIEPMTSCSVVKCSTDWATCPAAVKKEYFWAWEFGSDSFGQYKTRTADCGPQTADWV